MPNTEIKKNFPQNWMPTFTRKIFDFDNPTADMIDIRDIAHALSQECRFGNQTPTHYSVAQHSIHASQIVPAADALAALLHDATEAYISDMVSPFKRRFPAFLDYEMGLWRIISGKFGLDSYMPESVAHADRLMLAVECRDVMNWDPEEWGLEKPPAEYIVEPWAATLAEARFLAEFDRLYKAHHGMEYARALLYEAGI